MFYSFWMRKINASILFRISISGLCAMLALSSCSDSGGPKPAPMISFHSANIPVVQRSVSQLKRECNVNAMPIPSSNPVRQRAGKMSPKFITIHSTQNMGADAFQHSRALNAGRLRHTWHFTIDPSVSIQHIPLNETGRHADSGRLGDRFSIGIEMCEKRGDSIVRTYDRTAKLCAYLMKEHNIPLRNVVPHYYWTRKDCPKPLLDHGRPGYKWGWFISRVDYYYRCVNGGQSKFN